MFPIKWNKAYRKKDGSIANIDDSMGGGGGGYTLPTASAETKGGVKVGSGLSMSGETLNNSNPTPYTLPAATDSSLGGVKIGNGLSIDENGVLSASGGGGGFGVYQSIMFPTPAFQLNAGGSAYNPGSFAASIDWIRGNSPTYNFSTEDCTINDVYLPNVFKIFEYRHYIDSKIINDLDIELLYESLSEATGSVTLLDSLDNYSAILIQGCYDGSGANSYDTTAIYVDPALNTKYWFGMKDRNDSYGGYVTFSDNTHGSITSDGSTGTTRRLKIYGIPKD